MKKDAAKIIMVCVAYGVLAVVTYFHISLDIESSQHPIDLRQLRPVLTLAFVGSIVSLVANIMIVIKYKGWLRVLSILGTLISLVVAVLTFIPFAFSAG